MSKMQNCMLCSRKKDDLLATIFFTTIATELIALSQAKWASFFESQHIEAVEVIKSRNLV